MGETWCIKSEGILSESVKKWNTQLRKKLLRDQATISVSLLFIEKVFVFSLK